MSFALVMNVIDRTTSLPYVEPVRRGAKLAHGLAFGGVLIASLALVLVAGLRDPVPVGLLALAVFATGTIGAWTVEPRER